MDIEVECPRCGALVTVFVDPRGGEEQTWREDCPDCGTAFTLHAREEERSGFAVAVDPGSFAAEE